MSARRLSMMVIGGVGVAVAIAAIAWPGDDAKMSADASAAAAVAEPSGPSQLGIHGMEVDPARRKGRVEPPSSTLASLEGVSREPRVPRPPTTPPPLAPLTVVASADDLAAVEATNAARPAVLAAVTASLADRRDDLRRRCWTGDVPASASFPIEVTYSAEGDLRTLLVRDQQTAARGEAGDRQTRRGDAATAAVGACVRDQPSLVPLAIDPPGVAVAVEAVLSLP